MKVPILMMQEDNTVSFMVLMSSASLRRVLGSSLLLIQRNLLIWLTVAVSKVFTMEMGNCGVVSKFIFACDSVF